MAIFLAAAAVGLIAAGTIISAKGQIDAGKAAKAAAGRRGQALLVEKEAILQRAGQERAAGQREMISRRKEERLIQSRLTALAGGSGGGAADPTIIDLAGDIADEGEFRALSSIFEAEERARGLEFAGDVKQFEAGEQFSSGRQALKGAQTAALGTVISGVGKAIFAGATLGAGGAAAGGSSFGPAGSGTLSGI